MVWIMNRSFAPLHFIQHGFQILTADDGFASCDMASVFLAIKSSSNGGLGQLHPCSVKVVGGYCLNIQPLITHIIRRNTG